MIQNESKHSIVSIVYLIFLHEMCCMGDYSLNTHENVYLKWCNLTLLT